MKTAGTTLVEAAPRDTVWGIGLSAKNWKAQQREHWRGEYTHMYTASTWLCMVGLLVLDSVAVHIPACM